MYCCSTMQLAFATLTHEQTIHSRYRFVKSARGLRSPHAKQLKLGFYGGP